MMSFSVAKMKIIVAPLNWGLGHASRSAVLVEKMLADGHEVLLAGNGMSLTLLRRRFPDLRYVNLSDLKLTYSRGSTQVPALLRQVPKILRCALRDRQMLNQLLDIEHFDLLVSDNRFLLRSSRLRSVYLTHQLQILMPKRWRWLEPLANAVNRRMISHYDECWVPDNEKISLSLARRLSHPTRMPKCKVKYIGPLSRFSALTSDNGNNQDMRYDVVAVLSGLEPQRTMLEEQIIKDYLGKPEEVLIVRGLISQPKIKTRKQYLTFVPSLDDQPLAAAISLCSRVIARSGYSTLMDLSALGALHKATLIPTPGQSEQEYLASLYKSQDQSQNS